MSVLFVHCHDTSGSVQCLRIDTATLGRRPGMPDADAALWAFLALAGMRPLAERDAPKAVRSRHIATLPHSVEIAFPVARPHITLHRIDGRLFLGAPGTPEAMPMAPILLGMRVHDNPKGQRDPLAHSGLRPAFSYYQPDGHWEMDDAAKIRKGRREWAVVTGLLDAAFPVPHQPFCYPDPNAMACALAVAHNAAVPTVPPNGAQGELVASDMLLRTSPFCYTVERTPMFSPWAQQLPQEGRALGQALAPLVVSMPSGVALTLRGLFEPARAAQPSAHMLLLAKRAQADLEDVVARTRATLPART